jgi:hypothetical protein
MDIKDIEFSVKGLVLRIGTVKDEADLDIPNPLSIIDHIKKSGSRLPFDVFSFGQRLPEIHPKYDFPMEWDHIAVLEYGSHKHWFERTLDDKTRNMVRKAGKKGVDLRKVDYNDEFVRGIVDIYNETPIRQGRQFKHYGKSFEEVKKANASHLERSEFLGAFYMTELIGFLKLVYGDRSARAEQIISKMSHRDKAPTNALLSEAVKLCESHNVPYLIYGIWPQKDSFAQFKKNNGFKEYCLPRFYVPLNFRGKIGIKVGMHKDIKQRVPKAISRRFVEFRERWYSFRYKAR